MFGWLRTLILYRLLGGRAILALTAVGWLWRRLRGGGGAAERPDDVADAGRRAGVARRAGRYGRGEG